MAKATKTAARSQSRAVAAPAAQTVALPMKLPEGFKMRKQVILPTLSLKPGEPHTLVVTGPMVKSTYVDPDPAKAKEKPATVMPVGNVATGEAMNLLVPAVMESAIREGYPGLDTNGQPEYVGRVFYVEKLVKRPGKRYFDVKLIEVEKDGGDE